MELGIPVVDAAAYRSRVVRGLLRWYRRNRRDLPWRRQENNAYAQMLAELMLHQTQVATVIDYYNRFMRRFPTVADLAGADVDDVLTLWSGLGYYSRARNLHAAARRIIDEHGGVVPADVATLMTLPGIGRYTAGAIASIAYGTRAAVVDGNVIRVLMRLLAIDEDTKSPSLRDRLWHVAEWLLPAKHCGDFNQSMMELGATICRPKSPACMDCPIRRDCRAYHEGLTDQIPAVGSRTPVQPAEFVVAAVKCEDRLLFVQRPMTGLWAGLWELPSEPVDAGEDCRSARDRLRKRLPANCRLAATPTASTTRKLTHRIVTFRVYTSRVSRQKKTVGNPKMAEQPARWLRQDELCGIALSRATEAILNAIAPRRKAR